MGSDNARPLLRRWEPFEIKLPVGSGAAIRGWRTRRDRHSYLITFDALHPARGYCASHKDAGAASSAARPIPDVETGYPDLAEAQAACEADLRRLLGRLH